MERPGHESGRPQFPQRGPDVLRRPVCPCRRSVRLIKKLRNRKRAVESNPPLFSCFIKAQGFFSKKTPARMPFVHHNIHSCRNTPHPFHLCYTFPAINRSITRAPPRADRSEGKPAASYGGIEKAEQGRQKKQERQKSGDEKKKRGWKGHGWKRKETGKQRGTG